ncbi:MAG: TonB-dependent receptor [Tannerellaceae bacterium]|jgi:TonB-linked SusC/RagA family outer membrane protein|nr:TonB-dependent receptor [Tannerellaceae bacterium]
MTNKSWFFISFLLLAQWFAAVDVYAQHTVSGMVNDAAGIPIIGANVIEEGTNNGVITDMDGKFSLAVSNLNVTLTVTYVGYQSLIYPLKGKASAIIVLQEDLLNLDEVVVIGYGAVKKRDLTGSVSSVKGEKLQETASFSTHEALQGRAAGISVMRTNAVPGGSTSIRIRGNRSLKATNDPLYVVDGIPIVVGLNELSASDIESVEILKDASATAIYGSRGANGVIIISTKKGKAGRAQIDYNGYYGVQQAARTVDMMNGGEWVELVREANRATTKTTPYPLIPTLDWDKKIGYFTADKAVIDKISMGYDEQGIWHPERVPYNDWINEALREAPIQNHEISVRGGTDKIKMLASATYFDQMGIVKGQDYSRYSVRLNFDWNVTDRVTIGAQTQFSHFDQSAGTNIYHDSRGVYPLADIYDENGKMTTSRPGNDPVVWNYLLNIDNTKLIRRKDRFLGSYYVEIKLPLDINYRTNVGIDVGPYYNDNFYGALSSDRSGSLARAENKGDNRRMYTWENLLFYNKSFNNKHTIGLTFLQSIQQETYESFEIRVKDLPYENQLWYNVGSAQTIEGVSSNYSQWKLASFMGRANYTLMDKYLLTVSARYDGSSRLAPGHKWVLFPSAALAWRIKEENFLKDVSALSNLKLRIGYGITGNTAIDPYKTQGNLSYGRYIYGSQGVLSFYQNEMPNPYLTWEKTTQWNAGIDFGFLNGRIGGVIDFYLQKTEDMLMDRQLPIVSGFYGVTSNIGKINNKGIELTVNTQNITGKNFSWTTDLILAANKEEIDELYNGKLDDVGNSWFIGKPVRVFYDYKADGIWQLEDKAELEKWGGAFKPGDVKIVDTNGDYKITSEDRFVLGQVDPKFNLSLSNYLAFRNFDFNLFLTGSFGQMRKFDRNWSLNGRYNCARVNYWKIIGEDADGNPVSNKSNEAPRPNRDFENPNYIGALYYSDASFMRIGQATIGYNLNAAILNKLHISKLRIYASVQNAYVFTSFEGIDPELGNQSDNQGFNEPMPRTYLLGLNISF